MKAKQPTDLLLKAKLFRGLADPSRLAVLEVLRKGPTCVSEIARATGLSQPSTSMHLGCLEECGLVLSERKGKFIYYQLAYSEVTRVLNEAEAILSKVGAYIFQCTRYEAKDGQGFLKESSRRARARRSGAPDLGNLGSHMVTDPSSKRKQA